MPMTPFQKAIVKYGAIATGIMAIIGAGDWAMGAIKPVVDSGPLPLAGQEQVIDLQNETASAIGALAAQVQQQGAHQVDQDLLLNQSRQGAVLSDMTQLHELLKKDPNNPVYQRALNQDTNDLATLIQEHVDLTRAKNAKAPKPRIIILWKKR